MNKDVATAEAAWRYAVKQINKADNPDQIYRWDDLPAESKKYWIGLVEVVKKEMKDA